MNKLRVLTNCLLITLSLIMTGISISSVFVGKEPIEKALEQGKKQSTALMNSYLASSPFLQDLQKKIPSIPLVYAKERDLPQSKYALREDGRIGIGAYFPNVPMDGYVSVTEYEEKINHKLKYVLLFNAWGNESSKFPAEQIETMRSLQITPIITWEPWVIDHEDPTRVQVDYTLTSIASGAHDEYIREWAKGSKSANYPLILRFAHEQSTPIGEKSWYPWQGEPQEYIFAYRRIVELFRAEGATNVQFMWNPMWTHGASTAQYYPGDQYVDIVGVTALNHGTDIEAPAVWEGWLNCDYLIDRQVAAAVKWGKPLIFSEIASSEKGGNKVQWTTECLDRATKHTSIIGYVTLENPQDITETKVDWRTDTTVEALKAFREGIENPAFK